MKLAIDIGHNCPPDTGADGFGNEDKMNRLIGEQLISKLAKAGVDIVDCRPSKAASVNASLSKRCAAANRESADYFVSIHHNAGGGKGCEVYAVGEKGKAIAYHVLKKIVNLGFTDRGVKKNNFSVLVNTEMPAILIEVCFVDSQKDVELWESLGQEKIAQAIFDGLNGALKFT
jgi:N-acetylmuramoyl-L-alanine amidase